MFTFTWSRNFFNLNIFDIEKKAFSFARHKQRHHFPHCFLFNEQSDKVANGKAANTQVFWVVSLCTGPAIQISLSVFLLMSSECPPRTITFQHHEEEHLLWKESEGHLFLANYTDIQLMSAIIMSGYVTENTDFLIYPLMLILITHPITCIYDFF